MNNDESVTGNYKQPPSLLRLSVLDQSPVSDGVSPGQTLQNSVELARLADRLGYRRFWMSEHHAIDAFACTAPEVMLARIGAETQHIRVGSGALLLPHYSAFKVAELFRTLYALYPGRVDLGIGRAPDVGPIEAVALKRERNTIMPGDFPDQIAELLAYYDRTFSAGHPFARLRVAPEMPNSPDIWMHGSNHWSSTAAAEFGLPYAFAHFFSGASTRSAIRAYQRNFVPSLRRPEPEATAVVGVVCAENDHDAHHLASSVRLLQRRLAMNDRRPVAPPEFAQRELQIIGGAGPEEGEWPRNFVGTPAFVRARMEAMAAELNIQELVVNTIAWDHAGRLRSYQLLAEEFGLTSPAEIAADAITSPSGTYGRYQP